MLNSLISSKICDSLIYGVMLVGTFENQYFCDNILLFEDKTKFRQILSIYNLNP